MTVTCAVPDTRLGVALRLAGYLDCQARALGENGFQAMIGGPVMGGLLSAVVTLFVAVIGYRLLLGDRMEARDGIGWALRLGIVLALVTGWPAFQTLAYRVAVDGPVELAAVLLPAAGLPDEALDGRVQAAYDTIRLGDGRVAPEGGGGPTNGGASAERPAPADAAAIPANGLGAGQVPRPSSALLLVVTTSGLTAAFRLAVGLLLAIAPLPILCLLFEATAGIFAGWASALAGAALAVSATVVVTALELVMVEDEIAGVQAYSRGLVAAAVDPEALPVIIACFALIALVAIAAAFRTTSILRPVARRLVPGGTIVEASIADRRPAFAAGTTRGGATFPAGAGEYTRPSRATLLAGSLNQTIRREGPVAGIGPSEPVAGVPATGERSASVPTGLAGRNGATARRVAMRGSRTAATRDRAR